MSSASSVYVGRYAPSPTGPLHFGSLVAAVASYLDARSQQGKWLLRMEDLDKPREMPGAADDIVRTMEGYGFEWDGEIMYQSQRDPAYQEMLDQLIDMGLVYPCNCSRREIAAIAHAGIEGSVYPGTCRSGMSKSREAKAWRVKADAAHVVFKDFFKGSIDHHMHSDIGDFVLKRADGLFAYQLAVVVDDHEQGINHVVRGADLLNSTSRQVLLQYLLSIPSPAYAHIPLVTNANGEKLSKQTHATPVLVKDAAEHLFHAFEFLGFRNMPFNKKVDLKTLWQWGLEHWQLESVHA
jgi:glutamyl-Q tRNA(Asp) synthetase